jgi:integrase
MNETFADAFSLLIRVQASKAKNTRKQTESIIQNHLAPWFNAHAPSLSKFETEFEEVWSEYVAHCNSEHDGKRKIGHDRRFLVMALRRSQRKGWITRSFAKVDFPLLEFSEPIGKYIPGEKVQEILDFLFKNSPRTHLQVLMAHQMGMRISEILKLKKEEVNIELREVNLDPRRLKTRRARAEAILITDSVLPLLKARCEMHQGDYVFPFSLGGTAPTEDPQKPQTDNSYWWKKAKAHVKIECRFHDLRHSCLSNAIANGMEMSAVSKYFGATQAIINRIYHHIRPEDKERHRAIMGGKLQK